MVIGVGAYNNAATIGPVMEAVQAGLQRHQPAVESCIVLAEGGSTDGTPDVVRHALGPRAGRLVQVAYPVHPADLLEAAYHGLPGRPQALAAIFRTAAALGARACAVVDASVASLGADWIAALIEPALDGGFDFVAPCYARAPQEGALTRSIVYPLFRALYGVRLHQPAGGEFGCSRALLDHLLAQDGWQDGGHGVGVDIWTTTAAVCGGFKVCETRLGPRRHVSRDDAPDLSATIVQVIGALFTEQARRAEVWQRIRGSAGVPAFGTSPAVPEAPPVEVSQLVESFRLGYRELRDVWAAVLPPATIIALKRLVVGSAGAFAMDDELWARIIYDFAVGHRLRVLRPDHLLGALTPLYLGWLASFLGEVGTGDAAVVDERIERLALAFERQKPYLISRWRWPERFNA
ncbi:MAG: glycosyl transferase family 2 [Acidobacteriota bacterium]|nr:glycosyl transferase family 2 [Acidobacteriota bacterium]